MGLLKRRRNKTKRQSQQIRQPKKSNRIGKGKKNIAKHLAFINEVWDDHKTVRTNFENLGLALDPNESLSVKESRAIDESKIEEAKIETEQMKENLEAYEETKEKKVFFAKNERRYWERLIKAHGSDYKAMERDIKLNNYQHTKKKCEKKCKTYMELYGSPN